MVGAAFRLRGIFDFAGAPNVGGNWEDQRMGRSVQRGSALRLMRHVCTASRVRVSLCLATLSVFIGNGGAVTNPVFGVENESETVARQDVARQDAATDSATAFDSVETPRQPDSSTSTNLAADRGVSIDPGVCIVQPEEPASVEIFADYEGRRFYFCCELCRRDFLSDPARFASLAGDPDEDESYAFNDGPSPYANSFWGRIGRLWLWFRSVGKWFERVFHLSDAASAGLFILLCGSVLSIGGLWWRAWKRGVPLRPSLGVATLLLLVLLPCFYADSLRHDLRQTKQELELASEDLQRVDRAYQDLYDADQIHYATFLNFGDPPIPRPNPLSPALERTYFRGNDERSELMSHGGNYRTVTFELWIEDELGNRLSAGDSIVDENGQRKKFFVVSRFERASDTASGYFTDQYMQRMYVTMQAGTFLGRDEPVADRVPWTMTRHEQEWLAKYPLPEGVFVRTDSNLPGQIERERKIDPSRPNDLSGVVYLCEDRFDHKRMIGGRFHYAIGYDIRVEDEVVAAESDLWMEATYRGRNFADLQITDEEWLSQRPIPEK